MYECNIQIILNVKYFEMCIFDSSLQHFYFTQVHPSVLMYVHYIWYCICRLVDIEMCGGYLKYRRTDYAMYVG